MTAERITSAVLCRRLGITEAQLRKYRTLLRDSLSPREGRNHAYSPRDVQLISLAHRGTCPGTKLHYTEDAQAHQQALADLVEDVAALTRLATRLYSSLERLSKGPVTATASIHTLPDPRLRLRFPIGILTLSDPLGFEAVFPEAGIQALGSTRVEAIRRLREEIQSVFLRLLSDCPNDQRERFDVLSQIIAPRTAKAPQESPCAE